MRHEAHLYTRHRLDGLMLENMHDVPYVRAAHLLPETTASMTRLAVAMRRIAPPATACGIQILAGGNREALAVALAADLQFIRAEGFVLAHIADEGLHDACAGPLLRYRRHIGADGVLVFADLQKKHSSHAITADVTLLEAAHMAGFFQVDGVVLTGRATGEATRAHDVDAVFGHVEQPVLIGSGVTAANVHEYYRRSDALIVGSAFKEGGVWSNELSEKRIADFMATVGRLRERE